MQLRAGVVVQVGGSSGSRVLGCLVAPGGPMLDCCCELSQKRIGGEVCGTIALRSRCVTLTIWRECQGERAASRDRNNRPVTSPRYEVNVIFLKEILCSYCVADRLVFVWRCVWSRSVCVFGEKVQPVLKILLCVTGNLHPLVVATCTTINQVS